MSSEVTPDLASSTPSPDPGSGEAETPVTPARVLAVAAHPDDLDFGCAGTIATLTAAGSHVAYCLVTDGEAGGSDRTMSRADMAALRRQEQTEAAAQVGVDDLHFLGHPDGRVVADLALRRDISRIIRIVRPDLVICQSPMRDFERVYASHPDHLAAGEATMSAVYPDSRNPFAHPELLEEGLEPHTVPETWVMGGPGINYFHDVTEVIDKKIAALLCHRSQLPEPERMGLMLREWASHTGQLAGFIDGRLAEGFRRVITA